MNNQFPANILLTGSAGHAGGGIAQALTPETRVRGFDIKPSAEWVESFVGSVVDIDCCRRAAQGMDALVINHMGPRTPEDSYSPPFMGFDINVKGTANIYQACLEAGISQVVMISSVKALAPGADPNAPLTTCENGSGGDIYAVTKVMQETLARHFYEEHGMVTTVIRPAWIVYEHVCESKSGIPVPGFDPYLIDPEDLGDVVRLCLLRHPQIPECFIVGQPEYAGVPETMARLNWKPKHTFDHLRQEGRL